MKKLFSTVLSLFTIGAFSGFAQEDVSCVQKKSAILISVNSKDGVGYFADINGNKLFGQDFQEVSKFVNGLAAVKKDDRWGCINSRGEFKIPCVYDDLALVSKGIVVMTGNLYGLLDYNGNEILPCVYDNLPIYDECLSIVMLDGKYGLMNSEFELVAPCIYDDWEAVDYDSVEETFEPGSNMIVVLDGKYGMISSEGEVLIECMYDNLYSYSNLVVAQKDNLCGCLNLNGEVVIPFMYDDIDVHKDGNFVAKKDDKFGYFDRENNLIVPFMYDYIYEAAYNFLFSRIDDKLGLMTKKGEELLPCVYDNIEIVTENLFIVADGEKSGLVDRNGTVILPCKYDSISSLWTESGICDDYLLVFDGGKYGSVNYLGEQVVPCVYDDLVANVYKPEFDIDFDYDVDVSDVLKRLLPHGSYEYVNLAGKKFPNDEDFGDFFFGLASAKQNDKYGLMNIDGEIVAPCIYDEECIFLGDAVVVKKDGKYGTISFSGEELIPCKYDAYEPLGYMSSSLVLKKNDEYHIVSSDGTMEYPYVFEDVMVYRSNGCDIVKIAGKWWCLYKQEDPLLIPDDEIVPYVEGARSALQSMSKNEMMLSEIEEYMYDCILLKKSDQYKLINKFGKVIIPDCTYNVSVSEID